MLPMTSHLFSSGSYRSMVFPISEPIQPPVEAQCNHQLMFLSEVSQDAGYELLIKLTSLSSLLCVCFSSVYDSVFKHLSFQHNLQQ